MIRRPPTSTLFPYPPLSRSQWPEHVAASRWAPLAPPRNPALAPGGRLGPASTPAVVAAAWARGVLARWRDARRPPALLAPGLAAEPFATPPGLPGAQAPEQPPRPLRVGGVPLGARSEERRVGEEGRSRGAADH